MHDYTARLLNDQRMAEFSREADAGRLARQVRRAPRSRHLAAWLGSMASACMGQVARRGLRADAPTARSMAPAATQVSPGAE